MTYLVLELKNIFIFATLAFTVSLILFIAVYLMSFTSKVEFEKSSAYECGFAPFSETSFPFEVQFALIAIMFLLFDIEVLYLYPLVSSILIFSSFDFIIFTLFFVILTFGIVFEVSRNVMNITHTKNYNTISKT